MPIRPQVAKKMTSENRVRRARDGIGSGILNSVENYGCQAYGWKLDAPQNRLVKYNI